MARTKTVDPEAKARILRAAEQLFATRGYAETPLRDVANEAGVNAALIHYYFATKEGLYHDIIEDAAATVRQLLINTTDEAGTAEQKLSKFVAAYAQYILGHPHLARMLVREMMSGGKHLIEIAKRYAGSNYSMLRKTLAQGVKNGELRRLDLDLAPISLLGMVIVFQVVRPVASILLDHQEYDERFINRVSQHTIELFFRGAAADRKSATPSRSRRSAKAKRRPVR